MPSPCSLTAADIERSNKSRPHTPPYTPNHSRVRLDRANSPAPSIHPTETVSPVKSLDVRSEVPNTIVVQELVEGHPDYATNIELVYPDELEELDSDADVSDFSDSDDESDSNIASRLSQLQCGDKAGEAKMQKVRRERRLSKRLVNRTFKRSHSQSIKSDSEVTDVDAMDDHDLTSTARRLRRRTRGPDDLANLSASPGSRGPFASAQAESPTPSRSYDRRGAVTRQPRPRRETAVENSSSDDFMETSD